MDLTITIDFLSKQWIINMIITIICSFLFFIFASKTNKENLSYFLKISSFLVLAMTVANHLILAFSDSWTLKNNLPIHLCSISALICCFIGFIKNKQLLFEFLFYAGIIGGILSLLTPQITLYKELNFFYVMFYFKHASIIAIPIFMRFYMNMKLSKLSWLKVFGLINLLLAIVLPINSAIDSFVTPLTGGISKILGPVFKVKDILSKGINLANKIGDFLNCQPKNSTDSNGSNVKVIDGQQKAPKSQKEQQNMFDKAADYWKNAIRLAPNNYIEAQNWLKITGKLNENENF